MGTHAKDMHPEDLEAAIKDSLISAAARVGGHPGLVPGESVFDIMRERGLLSPKWRLTRKGAAAAKAAQKEYWG